jgi:MYXO-CTERM domain-containing protein
VTITFGAGITAAGGNFFMSKLTDAFVASAVAPIPEASTWAMVALGLAGLLAAARRRQA